MSIEHLQVEKQDKMFGVWLAELYQITEQETGQQAGQFKINLQAAKEWYDSGATPYACFRENWQSDGD